MRPGRFRVDEIRRHRRHAAPVVDARRHDGPERAGREVGRRLDRGRRPEDQPRGGDGPQQFLRAGLWRMGHLRVRLGAEILNDDLLHRAGGVVDLAQRQQRLDALAPRLADADQDAGGEGNPRFARKPDGFETPRGQLVRRAVMRHALLAEPVRGAFQHDAHRGRDAAQFRQLRRRHQARIEMRQQAGLLEDQPRHGLQIVERRFVAELRERLPRRAVAPLRLVAQGEQRFLAAGRRARPCNLKHLLRRHVGALAPARRLGESAVMADVAAEMRQRNEHLARIADARPVQPVAQPRRGVHEAVQVAATGKRQRLGGLGASVDKLLKFHTGRP